MKLISKISTFFLILFLPEVEAQTPTFTDDIAPIIWNNCINCHHVNGIASSTLITYTQVTDWASEIKFRINSTDPHYQMPPWTPDPEYRHYVGERILSSAEIDLITDWVDSGMPEGTSTLPPLPTFAEGSSIGVPDLVLSIPEYVSHATANNDDFVCFTLPTGITSPKMIQAIEIVPGNTEIVHHVAVLKDSSGFGTDTISHNCMGYGNFLTGYLPGSRPIIYPNGPELKMGMPLYPGENFIVNIHYHEGSGGMLDSTKINLKFYDDTVTNIREVKFNGAINGSGFCFDPNTVDTLEAVYPSMAGTSTPMSMINIVGHCHWLGKEVLVYMIDSFSDTIPLLHIPQWNFDWQDFYTFEYLQKFPIGARIYARTIYDNTTNNVDNPFTTPQMVCEGQNSTDEMFSVYFHYIDYQPGDEYLNLDSIFEQTYSGLSGESEIRTDLRTYPNPFSDEVIIQYQTESMTDVSVTVYNAQGVLVKTLINATKSSGKQIIRWNGSQDGSKPLPEGLYIICLNTGGQRIMQKVILSR